MISTNSRYDVSINVILGNAEVTEADTDRARAAAVAVLDAAGATAADAHAEYARQWDEFDDEAPMTGLARLWVEAGAAANSALTQGWHNPAGAMCTIYA